MKTHQFLNTHFRSNLLIALLLSVLVGTHVFSTATAVSQGFGMGESTLLQAGSFLPVVASAPVDRPRGIFVLAGLGGPNGGVEQSLKIINLVRDLDYIEGVTIGFSWADTEVSPGQYDFSKIDAVMAALSSSEKALNVEVFAVEVPAYLLAQLPAEEIWDAHAPGQRTVRTAVPWSQAALGAWEAYMQALAAHPVPLPDGTMVPLAEHPTLIMVDAPIVGLQDVRDLNNVLTKLPGYDRQTFIAAVVQSVHAARDVFPEKFGFLGLFRLNDANMAYPLDQAIVDRLMGDFNGPEQPTLGFFQETLSDAGPQASGLGKRLFAVKDQTYIVFQALTAWVNPFTGGDAVASGKAATGIQFAYETYNATYVELYLADVLDPNQTQDLQQWNAILITGDTP
ncbi:MAG: hypothetical protein ACOYYS_26885 [Chloroflexota bacterium]